MTKIEFKRELRDCPHNSLLQAQGVKQGLLYDFAIMIDGTRRGTFARRFSYRRGYALLDASRQPIKMEDRHYAGIQADARGDFQRIVTEALAAGRIPTVAQIAERTAEKARKAAEAKAVKLAEAQAEQVRQLGPRMLDVLKDITLGAGIVAGSNFYGVTAETMIAARTVIMLAEKPVEELEQ